MPLSLSLFLPLSVSLSLSFSPYVYICICLKSSTRFPLNETELQLSCPSFGGRCGHIDLGAEFPCS